MPHAKRSRFVVTFTVEVEHSGESADVRLDVEQAATDLVDETLHRHKGTFASGGVTIVDALSFGVDCE